MLDADEPTALLQAVDEVSQAAIGHEEGLRGCRGRGPQWHCRSRKGRARPVRSIGVEQASELNSEAAWRSRRGARLPASQTAQVAASRFGSPLPRHANE